MPATHAPPADGETEKLRAKLAQARTVIAHLIGGAAMGAEGERALDYFMSDRYEPGFLPWPRQSDEGIRPEDLSAANDG